MGDGGRGHDVIEPDLGADPHPRGPDPGLDVGRTLEEGDGRVGRVARRGDREAPDGAGGDVPPQVGEREPLVQEVAQRRGVEEEVDPAALEEAAGGEVAHPAAADADHAGAVGAEDPLGRELEPEIAEPVPRILEVPAPGPQERGVEPARGDPAEGPERDGTRGEHLGERLKRPCLVRRPRSSSGEHESYMHAGIVPPIAPPRHRETSRPVASPAGRMGGCATGDFLTVNDTQPPPFDRESM